MELADYLARYRSADLFLDTFYYNAGTTASDALWADLPVLTCLGQTFSGRMAASLLKAIGLPELITRSHADYESLALELAAHPERLAAVRRKLALNRTTHPLFDTARFTRHIEEAYLKDVSATPGRVGAGSHCGGGVTPVRDCRSGNSHLENAPLRRIRTNPLDAEYSANEQLTSAIRPYRVSARRSSGSV
jgi:hypothetical protein